MGSVIDYKMCECGNPDMVSDYYYKSDELYESCDVCGFYHSVRISNKPEDGKYSENWQPEYEEQKGATGYVLKVKGVNARGMEVGMVEEKDLQDIISTLEQDENVDFFAITYKGSKGYYQTQIFK